MNKPLVSIIIPVYNAQKYLPKCIDSIINQTYDNIEIICVNDGSTDFSLNILQDYSKNDSRIKVLNQKNSGVSVARNNALEYVQGEYVMFVDADDWIELVACDIAVNSIKMHNADVVMWDYIREFGNVSKPKNIFKNDIVFEENDIKRRLHRRMFGMVGDELTEPDKMDALSPVCMKLYKTESIRDIRFYDIREIGTFEDGLFNIEVFNNIRKAVYINKYLYHYRKDNEISVTTVYKSDLKTKHEKILDHMHKCILENNLSDEYLEALNNRTAFELVGYGLNILKLKKGKIKEIKKIISDKRYQKAYNNLNFDKLPMQWKIFYGCAKYNIATGVYILLLIMNELIKR